MYSVAFVIVPIVFHASRKSPNRWSSAGGHIDIRLPNERSNSPFVMPSICMDEITSRNWFARVEM